MVRHILILTKGQYTFPTNKANNKARKERGWRNQLDLIMVRKHGAD